MRNLFNALAKLLGLWFIYTGLYALMYVPKVAMQLSNHPSGFPIFMILGVQLISLGIVFYLAKLLIFNTNWIADKINVPKDSEDVDKFVERSTLLSVGIQLIGLFVFVSAVASLFTGIIASYTMRVQFQGLFGHDSWFFSALRDGVPFIVRIALSVICIFKADTIVKIMTNKGDIKWKKVIIGIVIIILATWVLLAIFRDSFMRQ